MDPNRKFNITDVARGAAFAARVTTRAEQSEIASVQEDGVLRVRLTASTAGEAAANEELIYLLASELEVEPHRVAVVAGFNTPDKLISVDGISTQDVEERFAHYRER